MVDVVVVGQVARDLVISTDAVPAAGGNAQVHKRIERLGGKGANQALGLHQLGLSAAVLGVVGTDQAGTHVLKEAEREGIDVTGVCRRGRTALLLDIVDAEGQRRLFEDIPGSALLDTDDLRAAEAHFRTAKTVCLQLQQPIDTVLTQSCTPTSSLTTRQRASFDDRGVALGAPHRPYECTHRRPV